MKASALPTKVQLPFGGGPNASSYMRTVPVASQQGITNGAASFTDGFPPVCFQPIGSGGVPPAGPDFQYLFNLVTAWNRWQGAGGLVTYDAAFSAAIGGYPKGAILASTTGQIIWLNSSDDNTTNPDSNSAANWVKIYSAVSAVVGGRVLFAKAVAGTYPWTCPTDGTTLARVRAVAGGGGGGNGNGYAGAGGLGGNYFEGVFNVVPGTTYQIVIGAGGPAGSNGGSTYISVQGGATLAIALGGTAGGAGGNPGTGNVGIAGNTPGLSGINFPYGGIELLGFGAQNGIYYSVGSTNIAQGGMGGGAPMFASATPFPVQNGQFNGTGCGGGGSGGAGSSSGGAGNAGALFIEG